MEEPTTTPVVVDYGAQAAQPADTTPTVAVDDTTAPVEQSTPNEGEPSTPSEPVAESDDDKLAKWAQAKGLELDSENAKKAAKMAREAEKAMHSKAQKASELEKDLSATSDVIAEEIASTTGQDPELLKRVQRMEVKSAVQDFWNQNPEARQHEAAMIQELQAKPHLAGDLESLYANVLVKSGSINAVKSQAKQETLQNLAQKQQAAVPAGNATVSGTPKPKAFAEKSIAEMEAELGFAKV